jgi:hypothetical protein
LAEEKIPMTMNESRLKDFARRYTAPWCSQNAASVAAHFAPAGSLKINQGELSVGRLAIAAAVHNFMTDFPDMQVFMNNIIPQEGNRAVYHWTLIGTHSGPGGTGHRVHLTGFEEWTFSPDNLIAQSLGQFDQALYAHQLQHGSDG